MFASNINKAKECKTKVVTKSMGLEAVPLNKFREKLSIYRTFQTRRNPIFKLLKAILNILQPKITVYKPISLP